MRKFLSSKPYKKAKAVGFDLDGTLYDEFEFIAQVYSCIVKRTAGGAQAVKEFMLERWMQKGSSYSVIFKEAEIKFHIKNFEKSALTVFRNFSPKLKLSSRTAFVLNQIRRDGKKLFLITDGRLKAQNGKIDSLGIRHYFDSVIITQERPKPDPYHGRQVVNRFALAPKHVIYIGDRDVDKRFARRCGFGYASARELC